MNGTHNDAEDEGALLRAFEMRHPGLALAWRLIRRRPVMGTITALTFLAASTIVIEGFGAGNALFQRWAETNWYAPVESHMRMEAIKKGAKAIDDSALHLGDYQTLRAPLAFYAIDGGTEPPISMATLSYIKERIDPYIVERAPQTLRSGQKIMAFYTRNNKIAETEGYVFVWDDTVWGLVPAEDYKSASLVTEDGDTK